MVIERFNGRNDHVHHFALPLHRPAGKDDGPMPGRLAISLMRLRANDEVGNACFVLIIWDSYSSHMMTDQVASAGLLPKIRTEIGAT